ncbi:hypothetical protein [Planococcus koreensis]|uniref:hypothetical protein n=1 Tax=Planococcus koreensis TaxID=112331 RepID=UPI0039FBA01C
MTLYQIGSITMPAVWIATLIALAVSAVAWRIISGEKIGEWYWNAFTLYFLVWKASYILFNFEEFMNFPMSVLYFNGGASGHMLALAALAVYLWMAVKKHAALSRDALPVLLLFLSDLKLRLPCLNSNWRLLFSIRFFLSALPPSSTFPAKEPLLAAHKSIFYSS